MSKKNVNTGSDLKRGGGGVSSNSNRNAGTVSAGSSIKRGSGGVTSGNRMRDGKTNATGSNIKRRG